MKFDGLGAKRGRWILHIFEALRILDYGLEAQSGRLLLHMAQCPGIFWAMTAARQKHRLLPVGRNHGQLLTILANSGHGFIQSLESLLPCHLVLA